jgi:hypothetical protein
MPQQPGALRPPRAMKTRSKTPKTRSSASPERFAEVLDAFAADRRLASVARAHRMEQQRGTPAKFGAGALKVHGRIFAMVVRGRLVKLAKDRVDELVGARQGTYFDPGHGRLMKQWVVVVDKRCSWVELAKEAHDFVRAQG